MKIITFFSEKGGVGKSSFSILFASWLKYNHGIKVGLADYNNRISGYRNTEINNRKRMIEKHPELQLQPHDVDSAWPIVVAKAKEIADEARNGSIVPNAAWLKREIQNGRLSDMDVVICDFPGSLSGHEFTDVYSQQMLGLIVIPIERDEMTIQSTYRLIKTLNGRESDYAVFINRAQLGLNNMKKVYEKFAELLKARGFKMLPDMISYSERMLSIDKVDIIRSTFAFPDFSKPEFAGSRDLGINNLFIDITKLLNAAPDYEGTGHTDLSFIDRCNKKNDGRNFTGSSFPELEIKQ